jgi:hypothetical protein
VNIGAPWPTLEAAEARVQEIQTKLHRWARDDPHRRFDDLYNLVGDPAFLLVAWDRVRCNKGARTAGVDGQTAYYIQAVRGLEGFLAELRDDLKARISSPCRCGNARSCGCRLFGSRHAACPYSWISPPSRSRRTTLPAGRTAADSPAPSGGTCPKPRCGRCTLS